MNIATLFASKFANVLNSNSSSSRDSLHSSFQSSIESWHLRDVHFSDEEVLEALSLLKSKKTDSDGVSSDHLKLASSAIAKPFAIFLTSVVRHGYLPQCLSDCILIPIPKGSKDPSCSQNYRAVALASSVSKVLEHLIIKKYSSIFVPVLCSLVLNLATLQLYVLVLLRTLFRVISIEVPLFWGVF